MVKTYHKLSRTKVCMNSYRLCLGPRAQKSQQTEKITYNSFYTLLSLPNQKYLGCNGNWWTAHSTNFLSLTICRHIRKRGGGIVLGFPIAKRISISPLEKDTTLLYFGICKQLLGHLSNDAWLFPKTRILLWENW